jgi:CRP/FNR family transcriptional regulator
MLTDSIKARLLELYPMLGRLPGTELEELQAHAASMKVPAETVIFDENQACQGFPLLLSGSVRVIKAAANGRELRLYRVCPGESCILTSSCLMGHSKYQARGIAETETEIILLAPASFARLLSIHEPFRDYVFGLFSERLTDMMQLVSAPPTRPWPTNSAACAKWSAACSSNSQNKAG